MAEDLNRKRCLEAAAENLNQKRGVLILEKIARRQASQKHGSVKTQPGPSHVVSSATVSGSRVFKVQSGYRPTSNNADYIGRRPRFLLGRATPKKQALKSSCLFSRRARKNPRRKNSNFQRYRPTFASCHKKTQITMKCEKIKTHKMANLQLSYLLKPHSSTRKKMFKHSERQVALNV